MVSCGVVRRGGSLYTPQAENETELAMADGLAAAVWLVGHGDGADAQAGLVWRGQAQGGGADPAAHLTLTGIPLWRG